MRDPLNWNTVSQNKDQSYEVHNRKESNNDILDVYIELSPLSDSDQHPADAELDWDNGGTIADLEYQEKLEFSSLAEGVLSEITARSNTFWP